VSLVGKSQPSRYVYFTIDNVISSIIDDCQGKIKRFSLILPLTTSLSSTIDDCQGKIKRFSLGNRLVEDKKDVANGKHIVIIFIA